MDRSVGVKWTEPEWAPSANGSQVFAWELMSKTDFQHPWIYSVRGVGWEATSFAFL